MANGKIRVSKSPEERKQEIMDIAMQVFSEKGYEQTTMRDIAKAVGIVPGLCYRYFESKQILFQSAMKNYIAECCAPFIKIMETKDLTLGQIMDYFAKAFIERDGKEKYHSFFHKQANKEFHLLMSCGMCEYLVPYIKDLIVKLNQKGVIKVEDPLAFSKFMLYGQVGILNDDNLTSEQKADMIKKLIKKLLES